MCSMLKPGKTLFYERLACSFFSCWEKKKNLEKRGIIFGNPRLGSPSQIMTKSSSRVKKNVPSINLFKLFSTFYIS